MIKKILKGYFKDYNKDTDLIEFIASTGNEDREGEVIDPNGWDLNNVGKNLPLLWSHNAKELPIGKVVEARIEGDNLVTAVEFAHKVNDFAKKVYELVKAGFLNAVSVGFMPKAYDAEGKMISQELLELSIVNVPANQEALRSEMYQAFCKSLKEMYIHQKPEETDKYIRIPTGIDCKVTATIDISKEKGISALYCGKTKEIRTYLFLKSKGWTMEKAKKWVEEHKSKQEDKQEKFNCECIECGHKVVSEKHCKDIKCPKCGGEMRRQERPGPGRDIEAEKKEGRIISEKTRNSIRIAIDAIKQAGTALSDLLNITEPPAKKGGVKIKEQSNNSRDKRIIQKARTVDKLVEAIIHELKKGGEI